MRPVAPRPAAAVGQGIEGDGSVRVDAGTFEILATHGVVIRIRHMIVPCLCRKRQRATIGMLGTCVNPLNLRMFFQFTV